MARRLCRTVLLLFAGFLAWTTPSAAQTVTSVDDQQVSVALVLAVDVSTSINDERFQLQRRGYADAFTNPAVIQAIRQTQHGRIAVTLVEWAGVDAQRVIVPWMVIDDDAAAQTFAQRLRAAPRPFDGWTSISGAIDFAVALFEQSPYQGARLVIDVSGDGINNSGRQPTVARDAAMGRSININGLVIMADAGSQGRGAYEPPLDEFYRDNVIGGTGSFVIAIDDFDSFAYAIVGKIVREVAGIAPETRLAGIDRPEIRIAGAGRPFETTAPVIFAELGDR